MPCSQKRLWEDMSLSTFESVVEAHCEDVGLETMDLGMGNGFEKHVSVACFKPAEILNIGKLAAGSPLKCSKHSLCCV